MQVSKLDQLIEIARTNFLACAILLYNAVDREKRIYSNLSPDQIIKQGHAPQVAFLVHLGKLLDAVLSTGYFRRHRNSPEVVTQMTARMENHIQKNGRDLKNYGIENWLNDLQQCTHDVLSLLRLKEEEITPECPQDKIDTLLNEVGIAFEGSLDVLEDEDDEDLENFELDEQMILEMELYHCTQALDKILLMPSIKYYQTMYPDKFAAGM